MVLAEEKKTIYFSQNNTFPGTWIKESLIDNQIQNLKTTRKELELSKNIPYCTRIEYKIEF